MALYRHLHGTIRADPHFDALRAADELEAALKASDKMNIIAIIVGINNQQRQELQQVYEFNYGAELKGKLKKALSSDLEDLILGLMELPSFYDSRQLHKAVKGLGTRESTLIDILCTRSHEELMSVKEAYEYEFGGPLEKDIEGDTSGDFQQLLLSILQPQALVDIDRELAKKDARLMAGNKKEKIDPDKATWARVFGHSTSAQLELVCYEYQMVTGQIIQKGIQKIFSGDARESYMLILKAIHNQPHFFASQLFAAMKGLGTSEADLNRILVARSERDLLAIKEEFLRSYGKKLEDAIKSECSGNYRDALLAVLEGNI